MENKPKRIIGRYTLVLENTFKEKFQHHFSEYNNSTKVPLAAIDEFTTRFANKEELFDEINQMNLVKNEYERAFITYQQNKKIKTLPVVFSEFAEIKELAKCKDSQIKIDNRVFTKVSSDFCRKIQDSYYKKFFTYSTEDTKLKEYIELYTVNGHYGYDPFNREKIIKKLQSYKQCREAIISMKQYDKKLEKIRRG